MDVFYQSHFASLIPRAIIISQIEYIRIVLKALNLNNLIIESIIMPYGPVANKYTIEWGGKIFTGFAYENLPEVLTESDYDYVLLCGNEDKVLDDLKEIGVAKKKIINLCMLYRTELFEKIKLLRYIEKHGHAYEAFVTGLSYAYYGTELGCFHLKTLNLAGPSQDLYRDYLWAKYFLEEKKYPIRYAIIGCAPYSFHYQMELSRDNSRVFNYLMVFNDVGEYHVTLESIKKMFRRDFFEIPDTIRENVDGFDINDPVGLKQLNNFVMGSKQRFESRERAKAWDKKRFPDTQKRNIEIFKRYISLCNFSNVHPIVVVYPVTDIYMKYFSRDLMTEFYNIIESIKSEGYDFSFLDLFYEKNNFTYEDFFDVDHLNRKGAEKVSIMIDALMK